MHVLRPRREPGARSTSTAVADTGGIQLRRVNRDNGRARHASPRRHAGPGPEGVATSEARHPEGGGVLVEATFVLPVFFALLLGVVEFGLAFKDYLTAANMSRTGARVASAAANDALADQRALAALERASAATSRAAIERIVVYRADTVDSPVPPVCTTSATGVASGAVRCNVYGPADIGRAPADFGCQPTSPDRFWCPRDRKVAQAGPGGPPDLVGVWVKIRHDYLTGLVGSSVELTNRTVMRVEPRRRR